MPSPVIGGRALAQACVLLGALGLVALVACGSDNDSNGSSSGADAGCTGLGCTQTYPDGGKPGCTGLGCNQVDCAAGVKTTLTGKVFDPAGKVPIYNATVYVPNGDPAPITTGLGATCDRCDSTSLTNPIAIAHTDATGSFTLPDIPANTDFPLVMQIGKWRRKVVIPKVASCQTVAVTDAQVTRLPRSRSEGDIPQIALGTGSADPLECLLRKIGLEASEFGVAGSPARIHLFKGSSTAPDTATSALEAGGTFTDATTLWGDAGALGKYDVVLLSCEGNEHPETKPEAALNALYDYAKKGGRVFTSHYHHYWFSSSPVPEVKGIATWVNGLTCPEPIAESCPKDPDKTLTVNATVNTSFAKGAAMRDWLENTGALTGPDGTLPIQEARHNVSAVGSTGISWMTIKNPAAGDKTAHEYVSFNAPVGAADADVCGRVVYTDLHVGAGDKTGDPFPTGCDDRELTPQQKALEFMLFDLSSCIQRDDQPVR